MVAECFVQCRVSNEIKSALQSMAQEQGVPESVIVKRLLHGTLSSRLPDAAIVATAPRPARKGRLSIRLRPDDALLLQARAEARAMPPATYVSVALRAHLQGAAPIPKTELDALLLAIRELQELRQLMLRFPQRTEGQQFPHMLKICTALRDHVGNLLKKNLESWQ